MTSRNDILISACDAQAIGLMLGDWPRRHRLEQETAAELATTIASARIVASDELAHDVVAMDSTVTYVEIPDGGAETVRIVYPVQANAGAGRVSVLSPIGRALLGALRRKRHRRAAAHRPAVRDQDRRSLAREGEQ